MTKVDQGKVDTTLVHPVIKRGIAEAIQYGLDTKYPLRDGWQDLDYMGDIEEFKQKIFASLHRHLDEYQEGVLEDHESGLHPLKHAAANLMMLMYYEDKFKVSTDGSVYINDSYKFNYEDPLKVTSDEEGTNTLDPQLVMYVEVLGEHAEDRLATLRSNIKRSVPDMYDRVNMYHTSIDVCLQPLNGQGWVIEEGDDLQVYDNGDVYRNAEFLFNYKEERGEPELVMHIKVEGDNAKDSTEILKTHIKDNVPDMYSRVSVFPDPSYCAICIQYFGTKCEIHYRDSLKVYNNGDVYINDDLVFNYKS